MEQVVAALALAVVVATITWVVGRRHGFEVRAKRKRQSEYGTLLFDFANDAIYLLRSDGSILDANDQAARLYGYSRDELRSMRLTDLKVADENSEERISSQMAQVSASSGMVFESVHRRRDGTLFPVEVSTRLVSTVGEKVFLSIARDVSERRRAERELRASEERQATILRSLPVAIYTARVPNTIDATWISESITRLTGFPASHFYERLGAWVERVHPDDRERVVAGYARIAEAHEVVLVYRWQVADGTFRTFIENAALLHSSSSDCEIIGTLLDITEQTQTETALRASEQRYRTLVENIHDMIVEFDAEGLVTYVSPNFELLAGYEPADTVGRHVFDNVNPDDLERISAELSKTWLRGFGHFVYRIRHRSGEWRWFESFTRTYTTPAGQLQGVMLARDITQNKLAEEALRKSEAKNRAILSALPDIVFQIDGAGVFLGCSAPDTSTLLLPPADFIGRKLEDVLPDWLASTTRQHLDQALATREMQSYDYQLSVSGTQCWFEARMVPVGEAAVVAVVRDITGRKHGESALLESENKYKSLTEQVPVGIYRTTAAGAVLYANSALAQILGYSSAEELIRAGSAESWYAVPGERAPLLAEWRQSGRAMSQELELKRRDGTHIWVRDSGRVTLGPTGEIEHIDGIIEDITERKRAEQALRLSEERYRQMFNMTLAIQLLIDPVTATVVDANPAACEFYRFGPEELKGMSLSVIDTRSLPVLVDELARLTTDVGATFHTQHRIASGEVRDVEIHASLVEVLGQRFAYAIIHDTTRRRRAEADRDRSMRLLKSTAGIAGSFLTIPDPRLAARQVVEILGKAASVDRCYWFEGFTDDHGRLLVRVMGEWCGPGIPSMTGHAVVHALPTESFPRFRQALQSGEVIAGKVSDFSPEEQALFALGDTKAVVLAPIVIRGMATGFLGFDQCVSPRLWQTEEIHLMHVAANTFAMALERWEQQRQREELAGVVEQASEAVILTGRDWRIRYTNPAFSSLTGFSREESLGLSPRELILADPPSPLHPEVQELPERGESWSGIIESRRKDRSALLTQSTVFPFRDGAGNIVGFASIHVDITGRVKLENQLQRAQKMEALGQFASGIAHDFNNLITVIQGTAELLLRRVGDNAMLKEELTTIRRTTQRSSALTSALLAFARRQMLQREDLDLNAVIGEALPMLRRVLPENITLRYTPAQVTCAVNADQGQIDQVLMNLVANARDAMPSGGSLTIVTESVALGPDYVAGHPWAQEGRYVKLSVTDTGVGMDEATLARVFDPFFTTKEPGKGTGLGLSTVFGIIKQHGGMIDAYSVPKMGSTFSVYLPQTDREVASTAGHQDIPAVVGGHEPILVVEDQGDLRRVLMSILQDLGYQVSGARDGIEALAMLEQGRIKYELVISDMVMPRLDGLELLRRCRELYPCQAFLLQSGYTEAGSAKSIPVAPRIGFISKPYSIEILAHRIRSLLDAPPQPASQ